VRRRVIIPLLLLLCAGLLAYLFTSTPLSIFVFGMGEGSPDYAHQWRDALKDLADPEAAQSAYPDIIWKRFDNGEWIFGVCSDSHSSHRGGTIVVKDSTGQVRAFFGHVCGPRWLERALLHGLKSLDEFQGPKSLDEFYGSETLSIFKFREYPLP
jgi:hypothetical protein